MNKEITLFELYKRLHENEDIPKRIKFLDDDVIYEYDETNKFYYYNGYSLYRMFYGEGNCLDLKFKILDEENDEFENIDIDGVIEISYSNWKEEQCDELVDNFIKLERKIKKLIKNQKKIIERLKKDE